MSILYLFIGTLGWIVLISVYYLKTINAGIKTARNAEATLRDGIVRVARIESKTIRKETEDTQQLELELRFKNLANVFLKMPYELNDSAPEKKRFEKGTKLNIRINRGLGDPLYIIEGAWVGKSRVMRSYTYGFIFLLVFCIGYLLFSYWLQNNGMGWRFLHFFHPWITIPYWGLFFGSLIGGLMFSDVVGVHSKDAVLNRKIVMQGEFAMAKLRNRSLTGTYINEQPQVRFEFEFRDRQGQVRVGEITKIISLLKLHTTTETELPILYLPEDPSKVILAEDYYPAESDLSLPDSSRPYIG
ncbi:hypothetical protein [Sphingobacterium sp. JB170]|uniref:hypothetical protein n=1 Tax=Sphingobacterium sp. JB170 TaxID=1434842 RepID=UPI00117B3026|nr:hypothetical protein [Sphingobacterium sp. JB170]